MQKARKAPRAPATSVMIDGRRYKAPIPNPFLEMIRSEGGIKIVTPHPNDSSARRRPRREKGPSAASLREIPPLRDDSKTKAKPNPYLERIRRSGGIVIRPR